MFHLQKNICFILIFSLLLSQSVSAGEMITIFRLTGEVQFQKQSTDKWEEIQDNRTAQVGDTVRTLDEGGAKVIFPDGSNIRLYDRTTMVIKDYEQTGGQKNSILQLLLGKLRLIVSPTGEGGNFQVETPSAIASVRGTKFEAALQVYTSEPDDNSIYKVTASPTTGPGDGKVKPGDGNLIIDSSENDDADFQMDIPKDDEKDKPEIPKIEKISPPEGACGEEIILFGNNFSDVRAVEISRDSDKNYIQVDKFQIINNGEIKVLLPGGLEEEEYYIRLVVAGKRTYINVIDGTVMVKSLATGEVKNLTPKDGPTSVGPDGINVLESGGLNTGEKVGIVGGILAGILIAVAANGGDEDTINVSSPRDNSTVTSSEININGTVKGKIKYIDVTVNDRNSVSIIPRGEKFSVRVYLSPGENNILLRGFDSSEGKLLTTTQLKVFYKPR